MSTTANLTAPAFVEHFPGKFKPLEDCIAKDLRNAIRVETESCRDVFERIEAYRMLLSVMSGRGTTVRDVLAH